MPRKPSPSIFNRRRLQRRARNGQFAKFGTYTVIKSLSGKVQLLKISQLSPESRRQVIPPSGQKLPRKLRPIKRAPPQRRAPPPPPPPPTMAGRGRKVEFVEEGFGRKGVKEFTYFRAQGTVGELDVYQAELFDEVIDDDTGVYLGSFFSNQPGVLGQVKFNGRIDVDEMIGMLNDALQPRGERTEGFDFRNVYPQWRYKWQVVETLGPSVRIVAFEEDGRE